MHLPTSVGIEEPTAGFSIYVINHPKCHARVALHGAHVMEWQPSSTSHPVLYLSPKAVLREGTAIRGGIPICWPWFGAAPLGVVGPSHGVARTQFWELSAVKEDEEGVTLVMKLNHGGLEATVTMKLGNQLTVTLETRNIGSQPKKLSGALHTYLKIDEIKRITVDGLAGCNYLDTIGIPTNRVQEGSVVFEGEVDRIYESSRSVRLDDLEMKRSLIVEKKGSPSTVVWNPWAGKSALLADLEDQAFVEFVCLETAISNPSAVSLPPGESHCLETTISVVE